MKPDRTADSHPITIHVIRAAAPAPQLSKRNPAHRPSAAAVFAGAAGLAASGCSPRRVHHAAQLSSSRRWAWPCSSGARSNSVARRRTGSSSAQPGSRSRCAGRSAATGLRWTRRRARASRDRKLAPGCDTELRILSRATAELPAAGGLCELGRKPLDAVCGDEHGAVGTRDEPPAAYESRATPP
jgi:hypothetical protein